MFDHLDFLNTFPKQSARFSYGESDEMAKTIGRLTALE